MRCGYLGCSHSTLNLLIFAKTPRNAGFYKTFTKLLQNKYPSGGKPYQNYTNPGLIHILAVRWASTLEHPVAHHGDFGKKRQETGLGCSVSG